MLCTRMAWSCLGALAVAAWLAMSPAQAQDDYHMVASGSSDNGDELAEVRSEVSELRSNMKASVSSGYDQGPSCGCSAHAAPSCGCGGEASCGCEASCGSESSCGCGCDSCGCESCCGTWGGFEPCCHSCGVY